MDFQRCLSLGTKPKESIGISFFVNILGILIHIALIVLIIGFFVKKYIKFRKTLVEQESMLNEIGELNREVASLVQEKEKILAMKVSQLGLSRI